MMEFVQIVVRCPLTYTLYYKDVNPVDEQDVTFANTLFDEDGQLKEDMTAKKLREAYLKGGWEDMSKDQLDWDVTTLARSFKVRELGKSVAIFDKDGLVKVVRERYSQIPQWERDD